jgi:hypothetical protein
MAGILKRRHDLVALRVMLDAGGAEPYVRFVLEVSENHELRTAGEWSYPPDALGLPARIARGGDRGPIPLRIPEKMRDELRAALNAAGDPAALWLHLVRPYAHLGVAPWDRVLTEELGLPVLRLPDFLVPPAKESPHTLDVALCVSQPAAKSPFDARAFIHSMLRDVAAGVPRGRVAVHLFTDAALYGDLRSERGGANPVVLPSQGAGELVMWLHDPRGAARYAEPDSVELVGDLPGSMDNPWLLWMRDVMRGRCLDVVHFGCHGYYALDRGAVALAASPVRNDDQGWARFVGAAELDTFLTQTGAWAVAFSSPPGNFSDAGLRHLADDLAQRKPFATIYHDLASDSACRDLAAAYEFLFDTQPMDPEPMRCVSIYCQPCRVTGDVPDVGAPAVQGTASAETPGEQIAADSLEGVSQGRKAATRAEAERRFGAPGGSGKYRASDGSGMSGGTGPGTSGGGGYGASIRGKMSGGPGGSSGSGGYGGMDASRHSAFGGEDADGLFRSDADDGTYRDGELEAASGGEAEATPGGEDRAPPGGVSETAGPAPPAAASAPDPAAAEATLAEVFRTAEAVPTWLAAGQRFVEGHAWQVRQWESQGSAPAGPEQQAEMDTTRQTLAQIQEVLARHAVAAQASGREP